MPIPDSAPEPDFHRLFDFLPGNYLILTPDFTMVAANEERLRSTMTTREQVLGRNLFDLFPDNPDDPAADGVRNLRASLERVLATGRPDTMAVQKYDIRRPESEGGGFEVRYWSPLNSPVLDEKGKVAYIVHKVEDVTEFIKLKQQGQEHDKLAEVLREKVQKAEMEVFKRAQELQEANRQLRDLDRLKTEFFANVSHELRTPLTLILLPAEVLLAQSGGLGEDLRGMLRTVHNNGLRLLQMINGLLDFSKLNAGKTKVHRESVDLAALSRSIWDDFQPAFRAKRLQGELKLPANGLAEMDRYLYERIVFNLLSNAVKFTPEGRQVGLSLALQGGRMVLEVRDTGIGISEADARKLFQKFHQVEGSAARRFEGSGLGLALVKEFSELLGGSVRLESRPGEGSLFRVEAEAPEPAVGSAPPAPALASQASRPPSVPALAAPLQDSGDESLPKLLVAEDNPELAAFIRELLTPVARVRLVGDGLQALEEVRAWRPDLVLSDVMMPRMDGIALTRELKSEPEGALRPVILLTALTDRESLLKGWAAGADDYLHKPFHPRELMARIQSLLSMVQWRKRAEEHRRERESLEKFTHIASHDLKEPLRKISTFSQLLRAGGKLDDPESLRQLDLIELSSRRMASMLEGLVKYARLDSQRQKVPVKLKDLAAQASLDLEADLRELKVDLDLGPLPEVRGVPQELAAVLRNLLSNALKYRSPGRLLRVKISSERRGPEWVISVEDNGIGFDPAQAERIFLLFERLHRHSEIPGDGMGLALCRRILEGHGGRIWAESVEGQGSAFRFSLPAHDAEPARSLS